MNPLRAAINFYHMRSSWLGDGGQPVPLPQAQRRADVCNACPKNQPHSIYSYFTQEAVNLLLPTIKLAKEMGLRVHGEEKLHVCDACGCHLPTKIYAPTQHVLASTKVEEMPPNCWLHSEAAMMTNPT